MNLYYFIKFKAEKRRENRTLKIQLSLAVMIAIEKLRPIGFDALRRFLQGFVRGTNETRRHNPWRREHDRIFNGRLPDKVFAVFPQTFDHVHIGAVEIAVFTEPGIFDEIPDVTTKTLPSPMPDRVSVV